MSFTVDQFNIWKRRRRVSVTPSYPPPPHGLFLSIKTLKEGGEARDFFRVQSESMAEAAVAVSGIRLPRS